MKKKIIFFDIDGTIMEESNGRILPSTINAIKKARENGHYAVINTGRTNYMLEKRLQETIGFDGYLLGCGTTIQFQGKNLLHRTITKEIADEIIKELRICKIDAVLEGEYALYLDEEENIHTDFFKQYLLEKELTYKKWDDINLSMDKFFMYADENSNFERFHSVLETSFDFIDRERGFWEVVPKEFSKASAIQFLIDYLHMDIEDTVAIGDSNNDLSMLEYVHTSIAMGNSTKTVLDGASFITTDVDKDGIEMALKWLGVI